MTLTKDSSDSDSNKKTLIEKQAQELIGDINLEELIPIKLHPGLILTSLIWPVLLLGLMVFFAPWQSGNALNQDNRVEKLLSNLRYQAALLDSDLGQDMSLLQLSVAEKNSVVQRLERL